MRRGKNVLLYVLSAGAVALTGLAAAASDDPRVPVLALVGVGLGFVLFRSNFGFAGSFRAVLERRDASGFKAQAVALATASVIFFPLLASGSFLGQTISGFGSPIGAALLLGGVLFGVGMQIGGGCASGTLFMLGGGDLRLAATLASFVAGSAIGAAHSHLWSTLPSLPATTSQDLLGWPAALSLHLLIFLAIYRLAPGESPSFARPRTHNLSCGALDHWPLAKGAIWLAVLNSLTLVLAGRPWGETAGFTLWGSKIAILLGFDAARWSYWAANPSALTHSVFSDITSVMDFGIVLGAAVAAATSGGFSLRYRAPPATWLGSVLGGLLMGYGARLSGGCNIGAYFSALASGSISAWIWVAAAFAGSAVGIRLRPMFKQS